MELYDHDSDPQEFNNILSDPKHAGSVAELKVLVDKNWANEYKPVGKGKKADAQCKKAKKKNVQTRIWRTCF